MNADLQRAMAAGERIFEILDSHNEVQEARRHGAGTVGRIEFRDVVRVRGTNGRATLDGVSFAVRAGQMLAVVGRSGANKTTLVNLIPVLRRDRGRDLGRRPRRSRCHARLLRSHIGMVAGNGALRRHDCRQCVWEARDHDRLKRRPARRTPTVHHPAGARLRRVDWGARRLSGGSGSIAITRAIYATRRF